MNPISYSIFMNDILEDLGRIFRLENYTPIDKILRTQRLKNYTPIDKEIKSYYDRFFENYCSTLMDNMYKIYGEVKDLSHFMFIEYVDRERNANIYLKEREEMIKSFCEGLSHKKEECVICLEMIPRQLQKTCQVNSHPNVYMCQACYERCGMKCPLCRGQNKIEDALDFDYLDGINKEVLDIIRNNRRSIKQHLCESYSDWCYSESSYVTDSDSDSTYTHQSDVT